MSGNTLVSRAVRGVLCDVCDWDEDVVEYLTTPMYADDGVNEPTKGVVRIYRLCRKCLNTGIAVLDDRV
jgi:hypothetical protein